MIGTVVAGKYTVLSQLGVGGMGAVMLARQAPLGREVALKILRPELVSDEVAIERFKREAQVIAHLGHPHVVTIHDFGATDDGTLFIAMERLAGEDLATRVARGPLPWPAALLIVEQIARALAGAHAMNVVHRDLKPANVFIVQGGGVTDFVKVLDFGIAKLVKEASSSSSPKLTGAGFVPGTPAYIAPENIMGGGGDDPRADLYSLGVTWFELLTGELPFTGPTTMKLLMQHLNDPAPRPSDIAPLDMPVVVEDLLMSLLEKSPDRRPVSANALLAALALVPRDLVPRDLVPRDSPARPPSQPRIAPMAPTAATSLANVQLPSLAAPPAASSSSQLSPTPAVRLRFAIVGAALVAGVVWQVVTSMAPPAPPAPPPAVAVSPAPLPPAIDLALPVATPLAVIEPLPPAPAPPPTPTPTPPTTPPPTPTPPTTPKKKNRPIEVAPVPAPVVVVAAPSADQLWRSDALETLERCSQGCATHIAAALRAFAADALPAAHKNVAITSCVARCRRSTAAP